MQKFTKTEISWIAIEFEKQAAYLKWQSENPIDRSEEKFSKIYPLRSEQYADISRRLRLALNNGDKRIEIKQIPTTLSKEVILIVSKALFSTGKNDWATPQELFDELNAEFHFTLDPCATPETAKCAKFYTEKDDGLAQDWTGETVFCNPPYSDQQQTEWVKKCHDHAVRGGQQLC